ncbi:retinoic acid receptor responder protein 2-like isoform X2 [Natator depressus]|uniref:retinoic acid receptor responder protein 2-like isoform X2 n=1 Tax=Natator depressus TaxID=27790 RepID=UPI003EBA3DF8
MRQASGRASLEPPCPGSPPPALSQGCRVFTGPWPLSGHGKSGFRRSREYPAGSFVRLRLRLQQTQCPNQPGSRQDCALKRRGRRQICLACVKFDSHSPSKVLDSHMHCRTETQQAVKEMETTRHEEKCRTVQETGEAPYHPGRFAFSRGLPS